MQIYAPVACTCVPAACVCLSCIAVHVKHSADDYEKAVDKIMMGIEKKGKRIGEPESHAISSSSL